MNSLIWIAGVLAVVWLVVVATAELVSFAVHLILIAAGALFLVWAVRKMMGHGNKAAG